MTIALPRATPESQGISSAGVLAFLRVAEQDDCGLHSFMLLRHGRVVAEGWWAPYGPGDPHMLFSLSKSFTSAAIGLAVAEGRLSVDDPVLKFFPAEAPRKPGANLAAMRVRHLLSMATGHDHDTTEYLYKRKDGDWVRAFLARPVAYAPGTHFLYNTGATYMLSAIVQRLTGQTLLEYLRPRLFEPLGIAGPTWEICPRGINTGGFGLSINTEDIARFGQLYLQRGRWQGQQLVPEDWVAEASAKQVPNDSNPEVDWQQGYGYQFWRCRHDAYRGDGAFGQFCVILPEQDAVIAITAGTPDMQKVLNLIWEHLLPAMGPGALAQDAAAHAALQHKLAGLALPTVPGSPAADLEAEAAGRWYTFDGPRKPWQALSFEFHAGHALCRIRDRFGERQVTCGYGNWIKGAAGWPLANPRDARQGGPYPVAASGAWIAPNIYEMKQVFYTTPFCFTLTCTFARDELLVKARMNVSFGPTEFPPLRGKIAAAG